MSDENGQNPISYLDNSHSQTSITISDLKKVLTALNKDQLSNSKQISIQLVSGRVIMLLHFVSIVVVSMSGI